MRIAEASTGGGTVAVAARDLVAGQRMSIGADRLFSSASLIKVPIMVAVLQQAESGRLPLSRQLPLDAVPRVGGSGVLTELADLDRLSVRDLLTLMIVISDNLATNLLIDAIGMDVVNESAAAAGLPDTRLRRTMMDLEGRRAGLENHTTATDMTAVLEQIALGRGLFGNQESYVVARDALARQQLNDRLPRQLPLERTSPTRPASWPGSGTTPVISRWMAGRCWCSPYSPRASAPPTIRTVPARSLPI